MPAGKAGVPLHDAAAKEFGPVVVVEDREPGAIDLGVLHVAEERPSAHAPASPFFVKRWPVQGEVEASSWEYSGLAPRAICASGRGGAAGKEHPAEGQRYKQKERFGGERGGAHGPSIIVTNAAEGLSQRCHNRVGST